MLFTKIKFLRKFPNLQYSQSRDTVSLYEFIMWMKIGMGPDMKPAELDVPVYKTWPRSYKTFFMLNLGEQEIYPAHKCYNANCWHFNIYKQDKYNI